MPCFISCFSGGGSRRPIRDVLSRLERQKRARQDIPDRTPDTPHLGTYFRKGGKGARRNRTSG
jgi:hypothetical protein